MFFILSGVPRTGLPPDPTDPNCGEGLGTCDPPKELNPDGSGSNQYWKNFVTALVAHNQNSNTAHIKYWEIWNEAYHTHGWNGTIPQMLRMAQDATAIIKAADPSAMVLTPSFVFTPRGEPGWTVIWLPEAGSMQTVSHSMAMCRGQGTLCRKTSITT